MKEIKLTQGKTALVDDADYEWLSQWKWVSRDNRGTYYASRIEYKRIPVLYLTYRRNLILMHRLIVDAPKNMVVDHINGNGLDNRRENLRICTPAENGRNRKMPINNTTGYKGVRWSKTPNKYVAEIKINGKRIHLGTFTDPIDAARAYDAAAKRLHGDFAFLNFPDGG